MAPNWRPRGPGPIISDDSHKPCFEFKRQGSCKFGNRCRYSHDVQATRRGHAVQPAHNGPRPSRDGKLLEWKRLLEQGPRSANPVISAASCFFQLGLELMEGDVGAAQQAVKLLATEPGLGFIKIVSDQHIPAMTSEAMRLDLWQTEVRPLFSLVTHACVVDSAVLEQQVSEVFNFIRGVGGSRMERVFDYVVRLVKSWPTSSLTTLSRMATVELSLAVLSKVVDCNSTAAFGPGFSRLVSQFAEIINQASTPEEEFSRLQAAKYLDYIQQRREVDDNIPDFQAQSQIPVTRGAFVLRRDLPGLLSADGPRHNNDKEDITQIKIMPTYEEIMSPRGEYLPTSDPSEWHVKGIRGRLDREFRLVREDTIGQLRDSVRDMLEFARNPQERESHRSKNSLRTYTYDFPIAIDVEIHRTGGMEMVVRCNQLPAVQKMNDKRRRDWWMQCKRLQSGALVCIFDVTGSMLFFTVSDTTMRSKDDREARRPQAREDEQTDENDKKPPPLTLSDDSDSLFVRLQLVDPGNYETKQALQWYRNVDKPLRRYLVEFPGVLLASFKHTLAALQQMHDRPNIPFQSLLTPPDSSKPEDGIKAPQYARKAGFVFDLKSVTHSNVPYTINPQRPPDPDQLSTLSTLDPTQSAALLNTLSRELSLIQGPPGTGKSYTGEKIVKVLLANKKKASLGPILCVCYTNHALDQLLEHLLDDGTEQIIRIGSRSKSERLQNLNLRNVVRGFIRTKAEGSGLYAAEHMIKDHVNRGKELLKQLSSCDSWSSVKTFLATEYPRHHAELFGYTEDGWKTVHHQPERVIEKWIHNGPQHPNPNRSPDILRAAPLKTMTFNERRRLHRYWLRGIRDPIISKLVKVHEEYNEEIKHRDRIRGDVDLRCLQQADVVGVTTTGLARSLEVLRKLRCKVMLCEEAGEVLEAHILTALLPSVEHGILIGDHLQLRPQIQNYDLQSTNPRGQQYSLDMSLFERLVQPPHETDLRVPYSVLETQRRMHPSIAELVRSTLYPSLKDADTVKNYPEVVGMKERLFWFHHEQLESKAESNDALSTSHSNNFEVEMTAALVSHLSRQGTYAQGDIAVLTPYLGQLHCLRRRMESMFEICVNERDLEELEALQADGTEVPSPRTSLVSKTTLLKSVRVATVDNFQGEEAKVIVISLVRSNPQSNCGFLRTSNRINVLLSRAQHGMYIIGNSDTYREVSMWADVIKMLARKNKFGSSLELQCPRHPDIPILVSQPDHFVQFSPESGCNLPFTVDFLEMKEYHEVDLDEEPCIFPDCGHFLTVSSMDGQMGMAAHYQLDENGLPEATLGESEPFSMDDKATKVCATCRGPLRNISRYGRIVRRAMLDGATKKFVSWSNDGYLALADRLITELEKLSNTPRLTIVAQSAKKDGSLALPGSRSKQINALKAFVGTERYKSISKFRNQLDTYARNVRKEEQPFQKVAELVRYANIQRGTSKTVQYDSSIVQVKGSLLASVLLLKCDIAIISDFLGSRILDESFSTRAVVQSDVGLDLSVYVEDCEDLIKVAHAMCVLAFLGSITVTGSITNVNPKSFAAFRYSQGTGYG
ncbi:hypothetical protein G7Z17_g2306 [Cylindrodendrum hubeiense]|uniref:C3H1-type domain-containing protein n=1 Tax=Cylindrodendrum hubeiense TaxID=595255 RepID=A0A9P5LKG3_9HYPO|nr:hypothetical protein G7Z17_g2306 [Cylindrodendrum hubeiense]